MSQKAPPPGSRYRPARFEDIRCTAGDVLSTILAPPQCRSFGMLPIFGMKEVKHFMLLDGLI